MKSCWMSLSRQGVLLMKYSLPPSRKTRRVIVTSLKPSSTPAVVRCSASTSPTVSDTSAMPNGLRPSVPLKITSAISPPRSALADCSPSTQRTASDTLDLPQPLGPTMAVMPGRKLSEVLSAKDLKPRTVRFFRYISGNEVNLNAKPQTSRKPQDMGASYSQAPYRWGVTRLIAPHLLLRFVLD